jgi:hypothetical protein
MPQVWRLYRERTSLGAWGDSEWPPVGGIFWDGRNAVGPNPPLRRHQVIAAIDPDRGRWIGARARGDPCSCLECKDYASARAQRQRLFSPFLLGFGRGLDLLVMDVASPSGSLDDNDVAAMQ